MDLINKLLLTAAALRILLIAFGEWQDNNLPVKYTDIDYTVFSDAARFVNEGGSPYDRDTYRYSPLIAYLLLPNLYIHHTWGKFLFAAADILVGWITQHVLTKRHVDPEYAAWCVATWLFNPFTFPVSTRGNCEALVGTLLLCVLTCLMNHQVFAASVLYGVAVHARLYPIIYALPLVLFLNFHYRRGPRHLGGLLSRDVLVFGGTSAAVFAALGLLFYRQYGDEFLHEAYLYHAGRSDPRHNFAPHFYHVYLTHAAPVAEGWGGRAAGAAARGAALVGLPLRFAHDLPFALFAQTFAFVAFNTVCTAQYFVWWMLLLPLLLPTLLASPESSPGPHSSAAGRGNPMLRSPRLPPRAVLSAAAIWGLAQVHWLAWAYLLEFQGRPVFACVWAASCAFLLANVHLLSAIIRHRRDLPLFSEGELVPLEAAAPAGRGASKRAD